MEKEATHSQPSESLDPLRAAGVVIVTRIGTVTDCHRADRDGHQEAVHPLYSL